MKNIFHQKHLLMFIFSLLIFTSCERDPIFGLERGWLLNEQSNEDNNSSLDDGDNDGNEDDDGDDDIIPSGFCNIVYQTTGTNFTYVNPPQSIYRFGDSFTVEVYSSIYSIGQVNSIYLILKDEVVYNFGNWLVFSNNKKTVTLPSESSTIVPSNCYAIAIVNGDDQYISSSFTIY